MTTQQITSKKLRPNGIKSQLILEAIGISHEILLGLMVQALIPRDLPRGGLDDRRIRNFNEGDEITADELTRMLKITLDHNDLLDKRCLAYEAAFKKIESRMNKLHGLLQESEAGGRVLNKSLRQLAESEAAKFFEKHERYPTAEILSRLVSRESFKQDPSKYKDAWEKKRKKLFPKMDLPAGWDRSTNWDFFEFDYRPLSVRNASKWLDEIKKNQPKKI